MTQEEEKLQKMMRFMGIWILDLNRRHFMLVRQNEVQNSMEEIQICLTRDRTK